MHIDITNNASGLTTTQENPTNCPGLDLCLYPFPCLFRLLCLLDFLECSWWLRFKMILMTPF